MNWLPSAQDVAHQISQAMATRNSADQLKKLAAVAQHRLTFVETIQIDNALKTIDVTEQSVGWPRVRLAILGSSTVQHLLAPLRVAGLRHGILFELYAGSYGQFRQEILVHSPALADFAPDFVLLAIGSADPLGGVSLADSVESVNLSIESYISEIRQLWQAIGANYGASVIQQSILDVSPTLFGSFDRLIPSAPSSVIETVNRTLADATSDAQVLWLDVAAQCARDGLNHWFDAARWLQGKMEISPNAAMDFGELVSRLIAAQYGRSKKCLVLDLDNTLWGGVIGDDGIDGITLGQGSAVGESHLALQQYAKTLNQGGIVLAVCSKNDEATAKKAFESHPEMHLKLDDIAVFVANWDDKAANLQSIAERLNIGLDALVFVDDNPVERARVREALPAVAVPELPKDPAAYVSCIAAAGYFDLVAFTTDDRQRAKQYAANAKRQSLSATAESMDDFLRNLNMVVTYGHVEAVDLARVGQLINKTNQFNTTTRRMTSDQVKQYSSNTENTMLQFRLADRFGDNGLVSVLLLVPDPTEPASMYLHSWVMSCRVFGRQLENEVMNIAMEIAKGQGVDKITADYIPTERNRVIENLYDVLGFSKVTQSDRDFVRWQIGVHAYQSKNTFIERMSK